jgi:tRNA pseudouridine38-40 synthase
MADMSESIRVRMSVAYNGAPFHGFAYQNPDIVTVAGELRRTLAPFTGGVEPEIFCAGRTDAGVHAWGQVVHFDAVPDIDVERIQKSLNKRLNPDIVVRSVDLVNNDFHARFSAKARRYRYTVQNSLFANPFNANTAWWVPAPLDIDAMNEACAHILGEHDFDSFCRRPDEAATLARNIRNAHWQRLDDGIVRFDIEANAFCHQMVRSLTGVLVAIGRGKRQPNDMAAALAARDRSTTEALAPPQGLCLWEVLY